MAKKVCKVSRMEQASYSWDEAKRIKICFIGQNI